MSVFRVNKTKNYTVISNYHLKEKGMSLKAKGLLSIMLSLPEDWDYSIVGLAKLSADGKDSVMSGLKELEKFGYLVRSQIVDEKGRFVQTAYNIYEKPHQFSPYAENPDAGFPNPGNPPQLNTNILSTKKIKKVSKGENEKEFTRDEEEVSPPPSDGNSSDNYQKLSNQKKVLYNSDQNIYFVELDSLGKQSNNNNDDSLITDESKKERKKVPAKKKEKPKREITKTFDDILDYYTNNQDIKDALVEFIKMRQRIRRPLTNRALALNLEKLDELASDDSEKLKIVQQTIMNSWQSFYGINDFGKFKKKSPSYDLEKYKEESNQIKKDYGDSYTMTIGWGDD